jgi:uncharacterized small protein (DUF1192 family)
VNNFLEDSLLKSFEKAQSFFYEHEYETALEMFRAISQSAEFENSKRIESLSYSIDCKKYLQNFTGIDSDRLKLVKLLFEEKRFSEIISILPLNFKKLDTAEALELVVLEWEVYIQVGLLEKSEAAAAKCLKAYFKKGDSAKLYQQSEKIKSFGLSKSLALQSDYMLDLMTGDEKKLTDDFERDLRKFYSKVKDRSLLSVRELTKELPAKLQKVWERKHVYKALKTWLSLQEEHLSAVALKRNAVSVFEFFITGENKFIENVLLINYSVKSRRFDFADLVSQNYKASKDLPELNLLVKKIEKEMVAYSEIPEGIGEDVDYATDLFRSEHVIGYDSSLKVKELEKKIKLLRDEGHVAKIQELVAELEELDPSHEFVKEIYEKKLFDAASRRLERHRNIDEVSEDLLKEIKVFSNIGDLSEDELTKSALRKTLEYMDDDLFRSSQADLTIAFLEMGFSKLAEWILDDPRGSQTQEYLEKKWYLKIQCMLENGDIHKCLDYINEEILTESLGGNDYICFLYMKAEVLRHLGQRLEALKVYKSVSQINPRYRLVRIRLQESV